MLSSKVCQESLATPLKTSVFKNVFTTQQDQLNEVLEVFSR